MRTILYILILLVPLLPIIAFQSISGQTNPVENMKEYDNNLFGIGINYPSNWIIDEYEKKIKSDDIIGINDIALFCPSPNTTSQNQVTVNNTGIICDNADKRFNVYAHNLPEDMNLEEFTNSKISAYKLDLTDFKIIKSNPNITIDGNPAYMITYTYKDNNDKELQVMEVWTVIDSDNDDLGDHAGKAYSIRYEAIPIEFPVYLNTANSTISSFEFKDIDND
jgi:hypothetical protein